MTLGDEQSPIGVTFFDNEQEWCSALRSAAGSDPNRFPIPLLRGPTAEHAVNLLTKRGATFEERRWTPGGPHSSELASFRPGGQIFAEDRHSPALGLAEYLAAATQRSLGHLPDSSTFFEYSGEASSRLWISELSDLDSGFAARLSRVPFSAGVLTARSADGLGAWLLRTLVGTRFADHPSVALDATEEPPFNSGVISRDEATGPRLHEVISQPWNVFMIDGHGRECAVHMVDSEFCGRAAFSTADRGVSLDQPSGPAACGQVDACFRMAWRPADQPRAADVNASIVMVNSCLAFKVDDSAFTADVSLVLALGESGASAIVSTPWVGTDARFVSPALAAFLAGGKALGEAVQLINACLEHSALEIGLMCLLGDPALIPNPRGQPSFEKFSRETISYTANSPYLELRAVSADAVPRVLTSSDAIVVSAPNEKVYVFPTSEGASIAVEGFEGNPLHELTYKHSPAVSALRSLAEFGISSRRVRVSRLESRLREADKALGVGLPQEPELRAAEDLLSQLESDRSHLEREVAEELVSKTENAFYLHMGYIGRFMVESVEDGQCRLCNAAGSLQYNLRSRIVHDLGRVFVMCPRCGETYEGPSQPSLKMEARGPLHLTRGDSFSHELTLTNKTRWEFPVAIGFSHHHERVWGTTSSQVKVVTLKPWGDAKVALEGEVGSRAIADQHRPRFFAVALGQIYLLSSITWVWAGTPGATWAGPSTSTST